MKLRYTVILTLLFCLTAFLSSMTGYISGVRARPEYHGTVSDAGTAAEQTRAASYNQEADETAVSSIGQETRPTYIVKSYGDGLSLFIVHADGSEELYQTYDVAVNSLPKSDREQLSEGVPFSALSDALQLIEDFSS